MSGGVHGILLAAGRSSRMGRSKPLLAAGDETFLARGMRVLREAGCDGVVAVVAAGDDEVRAAASATGATVVTNPYPGSEQIDSVRLAIGALPRDCTAAVLLPVDVPRVRVETIAALIDAWREAAAAPPLAVVPAYSDTPGHPVILARAMFPLLAAPDLPRGVESLIERHADRVLAIDVDDAGVLGDVDTPADYERLEAGAGAARAEAGDRAAGGATGVTARGPGAPGDSSAAGASAGATAPWLSLLHEREPGAGARRDALAPLSPLHAAAVAVTAETGGPPVAIIMALPPAPFAGGRVVLYDDGRTVGSFGDATLDAAATALGRDAIERGEPLTREIAVRDDATRPDDVVLLYAEVHRAPEELLIAGAGHIAVPLAALGLDLGFRVTVLDDRAEFAAEDRFADGVRVMRADFERDPFAGVTIGPRSYVALVTRGHKWDFDCLRRLLGLAVQPRYIGMIGSRRRVRAAFNALLEAGTPRSELARIHAPIGVDIGAETPMEIAISIAAELVRVRRGATAESLSARERVLERLVPEPGGARYE